LTNPDPELVIEAALFMAGRPLSDEELARLAGVSTEEVRDLISRIERFHRGRSISIERRPSGWYMTVRPEYQEVVGKLAPRPELTRGELRTLAVLLERGGMFLTELARIRGSSAYRHVKRLRSKGLVGVRKKDGKTYTWATRLARNFFDVPPSHR